MASRVLCRSVASRRSRSWFTRAWRRSSSFTSASPMSTRVMPGFFCAKPRSVVTVDSICFIASFSSAWILFTSVKTVCSMNSMSPSNICALLAKCR
jgi:hypothetical protein